MKKSMFLKILNELRRKPHLMRRAKIFAVVGVAMFVVTSALVIWAGYAAIGHVSRAASEVIHSPLTSRFVENQGAEVKKILGVQPLSCWLRVQSFMAVEPWLGRPIRDNLTILSEACFQKVPPPPVPTAAS